MAKSAYERKIDEIWRKNKRHKPGHLWHWAISAGNFRGRLRRFIALRKWAKKHGRAADSKERRQRFWKLWRGYRHKVNHMKRHHHGDPPSSGQGNFLTIDGRQVPRWIGEYVLKIRAAGRWNGSIVSGYRTPAYSTSLCMNMCGAPTCSGKCAGAGSNHACPPTHACQPREGAVDLTDYYTFGAECRRLGIPLYNHLPYDPVHYSGSGY